MEIAIPEFTKLGDIVFSFLDTCFGLLTWLSFFNIYKIKTSHKEITKKKTKNKMKYIFIAISLRLGDITDSFIKHKNYIEKLTESFYDLLV